MPLAGSAVDSQVTQKSEKLKIANDVKSGELTKRETRNLVRQREIRQDKRQAKAGGVTTAEERKEIGTVKRRADASIYRKKHNNPERNQA